MKLIDINNLKEIIHDSYSEPGEGILLSHIWLIIEFYNPTYSTQKKNEALLAIMEELMKRWLVKVNRAYKKGEAKPYWNEGYASYIFELKKFLSSVRLKDLENGDPGMVFGYFGHEFVDWQIPSVDELKKLGQKSYS